MEKRLLTTTIILVAFIVGGCGIPERYRPYAYYLYRAYSGPEH